MNILHSRFSQRRLAKRLAIRVPTILLGLALAGCQSTAVVKQAMIPASYSDADIEQAIGQLQQAEADFYNAGLQRFGYRAYQQGLTLNNRMPVLGESADEQYFGQLAELQGQLESIEHNALPAQQQLDARVLQFRLGQQLEWRSCGKLWSALDKQPLIPQQVLDQLGKHTRVQTIPQFRRLLDDMQGAAAVLKQWQGVLAERQQNGVLNLTSSRDAALAWLDSQLAGYPFADSSTASPFWTDIQHQLNGLNLYPSSHKLLQDDAVSAVTNYLLPTLRNLRSSIASLSVSPQLSWQQQPDGDRCYRLQLAQLGSVEAPELLQEIAKSRLSLLQQQLRQELQLDETADLAPQLRGWLASHQIAPEDLQDAAMNRLADLNSRLPNAFAELPTTPLVVHPETDPAYTLPRYQAPQPLLNQPGIYWTTKVGSNAHWRWPLDLYKATLPGQHLQIAMAQENDTLPEYRKTSLLAEFEPGWNSVAAELASDLGGYRNSSEHAWVLLDEMEQELNLILDIGVHLYQWDIAKTSSYCSINSFLSEQECQQRSKAIMASPSSYAFNAISHANLAELMQQAQDQTDDTRAMMQFHSDYLKQGTLPAAMYQPWLQLWLQSH